MKSLTLILFFISLYTSGQDRLIFTQENEKKKISDFFHDKDIFNTTVDSNKLYSFYFRIVIKEDNKGQTSVASLTSNDSIAYKLFPNYRFLKTISYSVFMRNRNKATFIIPVILEVFSSKGIDKECKSPLPYFQTIFAEDSDDIEDHIYFRPQLIRINKQVFD